MPNIAKLLKDEITRLAKKEVKSVSSPIKGDTVKLKKTVAALKRQIALLERTVKGIAAQRNASLTPETEASAGGRRQRRLTSDNIRVIRKKLDVSQAGLARLLGASTATVSQWEQRNTILNLRSKMDAAVREVRELTPKEAKARLQAKDTKGSGRKPRTIRLVRRAKKG